MTIRSFFTEPFNRRNGAYRYGMLAVILGLLVFNICWLPQPSQTYPDDRYLNMVCALMFLFSHLAFEFRWSSWVTVALRVCAVAWLAFTFFYLFNLWYHR